MLQVFSEVDRDGGALDASVVLRVGQPIAGRLVGCVSLVPRFNLQTLRFSEDIFLHLVVIKIPLLYRW